MLIAEDPGMTMIQTIINNQSESFELLAGTVLLDVLRNNLKLKGTKEGCREGDCGSCVVLWGKLQTHQMEYRTVNSCLFPLGDAEHTHVVTIEGLNGDTLNPIQQAIVDEGASQCGFCTPGFVISMTGYLLQARTLDLPAAIAFLAGNICRCTGYSAIIRAMERILNSINPDDFAHSHSDTRIPFLVQQKFLPAYFLGIPDRIQNLPLPPTLPFTPKLVLAGGTDLYLQKGEDVTEANLFLLSQEAAFKGIYLENQQCVIRAATTITELETSAIIQHVWPDFKKYIQLISCPSIRNRATVGGNIINASPIGDLSIMLLALDATVVLQNKERVRAVKLKDFFRGYKQLDKLPTELLHSIYFPIPPKSGRFHFEKVSRRTHLDIASVNSALMIAIENNQVKEIHLAAGGVAPIPCYLARAAASLKDKALNPGNVAAAIAIALSEVTPITDVRGTAEYKKLLLRQLIRAHFITLFPEMSGADNSPV